MYDNECHLNRPQTMMRYSDTALRKPTSHGLTPVSDEERHGPFQSFNAKILTKALVKLRQWAPKQTSARRLWPGTRSIALLGCA